MVANVDGFFGGRVIYDLTDVERVYRADPVGRDPAHVAHGPCAIREPISAMNRVVYEPGDAVLVSVHAHAISTSQNVLVTYRLRAGDGSVIYHYHVRT